MADADNNDAHAPQTDPSDATVSAEEQEARSGHGADSPPTAEEDAKAPEGPVSRSVADAEKAAAERGANVKGEGQID